MEVFIEIPKNSNIKYEYDKESDKIFVDRVIHNTNTYPYNYGFIPNTLAPDNDPIDVILISDHIYIPGCTIKCKVIGGIYTSDENGQDDKIFCVPIDKIDPKSVYINNISDINDYTISNIKYFLNHYKDNENKKVIIGDIYNKEDALMFIDKYSINI